MIPSLERNRANKAAERIRGHIEQHPSKMPFWEAYGNVARGLPLAIRQQGLARAVQTEVIGVGKLSGEKKEGGMAALGDICEGLLAWHETAKKPAGFNDLINAFKSKSGLNERVDALIAEAITLGFWDYTVLQREVIEIVAWLKILAEPHRPKKQKGGPAPAPGTQPPDPSTMADAAADGDGVVSQEPSP